MIQAEKLRIAMAVQQLTYDEVATGTGMARQTVSRICKGIEREPNLSSVYAICRFLKVNPQEVFAPLEFDEQPEPIAA